MAYVSKNNAYSTLAAGITDVQTSLQVTAGHGDRFPVVAGSDYTYVTLEDTSGNIEIVKVTARASASDTMTIVRAQEGTTARAWNSGDVVEHRLTAGVMEAGLNAANDLATHLADTTAAHAASAISYAGNAGLSATDVEAALDELDNEKAAATDLTAHLNDTTDAHDASAISYAGNAGLSATDVEGAIDELDNEKATKASTQTIWVPAAAMTARTTNGAATGTAETTTNKVMLKTLDFDTTTQEFAQFAVRMPKGWDEGTVTAAFVWSHASTTTNFGVVWQLQGVALSDDDALDAAFGTAQAATDTGGTTDDLYVSPTTSAITIAGSPAAEDYVVFQVARAPSDGSDNLAVDARLHGVTIYYTTTDLNDA